MTTEQQAVETETEAQVTPVVEESSDAQDLESLLSEWESDEQPETATPTEEKLSAEEIKEFIKLSKQERDEKVQEATSKAYQDTIKSIKGDLTVNDKIIDGFLRVKAAEDPRVLKAYQNRGKSPEAWSKVEKAINKEMRDMLGSLPDKGSTETRKAVTAAISNSKTSTPDPIKNLGSMSNAEFEKAKANAFGV